MSHAVARLLRRVLFAWLACAGHAAQALPEQVVHIAQTEFVKSDAADPPQAGWQPQSLPDSWRISRPGQDGYGWYRARFPHPAADGGMAGILISVVATTYAIRVNGIEIADGGGITGPIRRNAGEPQFVTVPPQVLIPGENLLEIRLRVAPNLRGGLTPLLVGPRAAIEALYDSEYFWRVTLTRSANVALIVAGLIVGVLWLRRPKESMYGWFAALAILWSLRNFHYTYTGSAIPSRLWEAFILGSLGVVLLLLLLFMLRLTRQSWPRTERALLWVCLGMPPAFHLLGQKTMSELRLVWYTLCIALGISAMVVLARHLLRGGAQRNPGHWLILAAMCVTLAFGLHDYAVSANWLPFGAASWMAYGAPLLLAALVFAVAGEYFGAFDAVRELNENLEKRVAERTAELQSSYQRMTELERAAAVAGERERLMRDIHDGVGSQLMTALSGFERGRMSSEAAAEVLRQCIAELRLVIDSLDPEQRCIADALATLRYRIEPKLQAAGIDSDWEIDSARSVEMGPGQMLDLVRIVQEALSNALRHAGACRVSIAFAAGTPWELTIADDGCGLPASQAAIAPGRGLVNMRRRAQRLDATLRLDAADETTGRGLRVTVTGAAPSMTIAH